MFNYGELTSEDIESLFRELEALVNRYVMSEVGKRKILTTLMILRTVVLQKLK